MRERVDGEVKCPLSVRLRRNSVAGVRTARHIASRTGSTARGMNAGRVSSATQAIG